MITESPDTSIRRLPGAKRYNTNKTKMLAIPLRDETLQGNPHIKLNTVKIPESNITLHCSFVSGIKRTFETITVVVFVIPA